MCCLLPTTLWTHCVSHRIAGHPLAQNELSLHMFLQEPSIDKKYTPGKVRAK